MTAEQANDFERRLRSLKGGKTNADDAEGESKPSAVEAALAALAASISELWHTPANEAMLTHTTSEGIDLHMMIGASDTADWLAYRYYLATGKPISEATQKAAIGILSVKARYEGEEHPVYSRIAHHDGDVWIDLGDDQHRAVRISADLLPRGWAVVASNEVPVRFRRSKSASALPLPVEGGSIDALWTIAPNTTPEDRILILAWLVGAFQEHGGRNHLEIVGGQGSGKSTLGRVLVDLVDPNVAPLRAMPQNERDLLISTLWRSVAGMDNLSVIAAEMADALCRLSTGAGVSTRTLYSNAEETIFAAQLPMLWTAIEQVAVRRADLQDRTTTIRLEPLPDDAVVSERNLTARFEAMRPELIGALYTAVATGLSCVDTMEIDRLPRLADFATWVEACAPAFGWEPGLFIETFESSRAVASAMALDASPVGPLIVRFMDDRKHWEGTAGDLLDELKRLADDDQKRSRSFPKDPTRLSGQVRRLVQPLKTVGVFVGFDRSGRSRGIVLDRKASFWSQPAMPVADGEVF